MQTILGAGEPIGLEKARVPPEYREFGPSLYCVEGPIVPFYGFPYPTRMAIARLSGGGLWIWSPVALSDDLEAWVDRLGPVEHIVSPNKIHHLFLKEWADRWPDARVYAPPGLARKRQDIHFDAELDDEPEQAWAGQVDQVVFRGSFVMQEVAFFHRESQTAIVCDLIQRFPESAATGWKGKLMKVDGLVGEHGSTPREWRATFLRRGPARAARDRLLGWQPERLLIAHGSCAISGATEIVRDGLGWI